MTESIDPRDFGALEANVAALTKQVQSMDSDIKELLALANKSKGGFWMGMAIASAVGGLGTYILEKFAK